MKPGDLYWKRGNDWLAAARLWMPWGDAWMLKIAWVALYFDPDAPFNLHWWRESNEIAVYLWPFGVQVLW